MTWQKNFWRLDKWFFFFFGKSKPIWQQQQQQKKKIPPAVKTTVVEDDAWDQLGESWWSGEGGWWWGRRASSSQHEKTRGEERVLFWKKAGRWQANDERGSSSCRLGEASWQDSRLPNDSRRIMTAQKSERRNVSARERGEKTQSSKVFLSGAPCL